jgi:hypothetical protein
MRINHCAIACVLTLGLDIGWSCRRSSRGGGRRSNFNPNDALKDLAGRDQSEGNADSVRCSAHVRWWLTSRTRSESAACPRSGRS